MSSLWSETYRWTKTIPRAHMHRWGVRNATQNGALCLSAQKIQLLPWQRSEAVLRSRIWLEDHFHSLLRALKTPRNILRSSVRVCCSFHDRFCWLVFFEKVTCLLQKCHRAHSVLPSVKSSESLSDGTRESDSTGEEFPLRSNLIHAFSEAKTSVWLFFCWVIKKGWSHAQLVVSNSRLLCTFVNGKCLALVHHNPSCYVANVRKCQIPW